jgi:alpha-beta hydrolase superfamily lysophospholipase
MEGCTDGKGELTLVFELSGQTIDCTNLYVQLLRVGEMYERGRVTVDAPGIPNPWEKPKPLVLAWEPDIAAGSPKIDPSAKAKTIIWVHGWRMDYAEYESWADTSFKRLWQMGFRGRFYAFRWPTFSSENDGLPSIEKITPLDLWRDGGLTYNASEYRSLLCGKTFANFVNQTPNSESRYLFAHSMGNVIAGSALRSGMKITKYALCNAAMASMAYDGAHNDNEDNNFVTIDTDTTPLAAAIWGLSNLFNPTGRTTMTNFALEADEALDLWRLNNKFFKPYDLIAWGYGYDRWTADPNEKLWHGRLGGVSFKRYIDTHAEAFGYCVQARTRAAGAKTNVGNMSSTVDMGEFGFGAKHSEQWIRCYQGSYAFWKELMKTFEEDVTNR